jgi:N-acyl-D-aspartate/D-glutamate deacylase
MREINMTGIPLVGALKLSYRPCSGKERGWRSNSTWCSARSRCTTAPARAITADVAIEGDRIAALGSAPGSARETVDGRGLALAPGFIDVHTHDDLAAVKHPDMAFKLQGGVTTCIVGNCGFGAAPFDAAFGPGSVLGKALGSALEAWSGYRGYAENLERNPPGTNIGVLIGARHRAPCGDGE